MQVKMYILILFLYYIILLPFVKCADEETKWNCRFNVTKNGTVKHYDFTSLSHDNWLMEINNNKEQMGFISLCGNQRNTPCGSPGVCIAEKKDDYWSPVFNAGKIMQKKDEQDPKSVTLTVILTGGDKCPSGTYSSEINFRCSEQIGEPRLILNETCKLVIVWETSAACPLSVQDPCSLQGASSFNLWPLHHMLYYRVPAAGREFLINICDAVHSELCKGQKGTAAGACEVEPGTNKTKEVLGLLSRRHFDYSEKGLILTYKAQNKKNKTEIHFICNTDVPIKKPKFISSSNTTYVFEMETSLACVSRPLECIVYDKQGYKYDLQSLSKTSKNWVVTDRSRHQNITYYINICRPLIPSSEFNCSDGATSVCQTINHGNGTSTSVSLGVLGRGPQAADDHAVIYYTGGSPCENGGLRRRTVITFECSQKEREPIFESESHDCVYTFIWSTPVACSVKAAVGENCIVRGSTSDQVFDLNPLYNSETDYLMSTENGNIFRMNLCRPLLKPCNGKNVSVCLENGGKELAIGELATKPLYEDGRVSFVLSGESCKEGQNTTKVHVIIMCNQHSQVGSTAPEHFTEGEDCTFYFVWSSVLACPDFEEYPCRAEDSKGREYDLSPLSDPSGNYVITRSTSHGSLRFLLNLCRSVVYGHGATCAPKSGICLFNMSETKNHKKYQNLGDVVSPKGGEMVQSKLLFVDHQLQITYNDGDICLDGGQPHIRSTIYFFCDKENEQSGPNFLQESNCHFEFEWGTKYACSQGIQEESVTLGNCTTFNQFTRFRYDLNPLANEVHHVKSLHGKEFALAVCNSSKACGDKAGNCISNNGKFENAGLWNSDLQFDYSGSLFLAYENGNECAPGVNSSTVIEFFCMRDKEKTGPRFVDTKSNCTYIFHWPTELACDVNHQVPCKAVGSRKEVDLSALINTNKNYVTTTKDSEFFINVCHPLVPQEGLSCTGGSSVCKAQHESDGTWSHEMNVGHVMSLNIVNEEPVLTYKMGSQCPVSGLKYSTSIYFSCEPTIDIGNPVFQNFSNNCEYKFLWRTSVVCNDYEMSIHDEISSYFIYNDQRHVAIDVEPLCNEGGYKVEKFTLNMCKAVDAPRNVQWFDGNKHISYGKIQKMIFSYSQNLTKLIFSSNDTCNEEGKEKEFFKAEVRLKCVPEAGIGKPDLLMTASCEAVFNWDTNVSCGWIIKDIRVDASKSHVSVAGILVGILLTLIACAVVLFLRKPANRNWCRNHLCGLLNKRHHGQFHYSRLEATDEASILLASQSDGVESDSDDELLRT